MYADLGKIIGFQLIASSHGLTSHVMKLIPYLVPIHSKKITRRTDWSLMSAGSEVKSGEERSTRHPLSIFLTLSLRLSLP